MNPELLEELHSYHLRALLEIDRICKKHGIHYSIIAGTLLGAIRHKGFIPWDDDLDIGLLRSEYDKLLSILPEELDKQFFLQTNGTNPDYFLSFAKIRINGTKFVERSTKQCAIHHGIYIDLFPFDNVPASKPAQLQQRAATKLLYTLALARSNFRLYTSSALKRSCFQALKIAVKPFPLRFLLHRMEKAMRRANGTPTETVVNIGGAYGYRKESIRRSYFEEMTDLEFEGHMVSGFAQWHDYLSGFYGDYRTPPPEDKRYNRHNTVEVSFR